MPDVKTLNKRLLETYGSTLDGKAHYRLVWSEDTFEKRKGDFVKRTEAGIILGELRNHVEVMRKYEYLKERWILEYYTPAQKMLEEVAQLDFYEPVFAFQDSKGNYLEPAWFALEYIVHRHRAILSGNLERRTEAMDKADAEALEEKETADFLAYLENESSDLQNQFRNQEAVIIHRED